MGCIAQKSEAAPDRAESDEDEKTLGVSVATAGYFLPSRLCAYAVSLPAVPPLGMGCIARN
jgi:hypothetical protein